MNDKRGDVQLPEEHRLRKIDKKEFMKILAEHRKWLNSKGQEGTQADFSNRNLDNLDFKGVDLPWTKRLLKRFRRAYLPGPNLQRAKFKGASLYSADLRGADLRRANLQGAKLRWADLQGADLREADLRNANLWMAKLEKAKLNKADLRNANLQKVKLQRTVLLRADLQGANLRDAELQQANLREANIADANLEKANLREAQFQGAQLQRANLRETNLRNADLGGTDLHEADLRESDLRGVNLQWSNLQNAKLREADLAGANLQKADLRGAELQDAILQGADLTSAKLKNAVLFKANLQGAKLQKANLQEANLQEANLQEANLSETNLQKAELQKATLLNTSLQEADLQGANLVGTKELVVAQLRGANLKDAKLQDNPDNIRDSLEAAGREVEEISKVAKKLLFGFGQGSMPFLCMYTLLVVFATTDAQLLTNIGSTTLPVFGTKIPTVGFYLGMPLFLLGLYIVLNLYLQKLWERLSEMPAVFHDGSTLDEKADLWPLNRFVRSKFKFLKHKIRPLAALEKWVSIFLVWWIVPVTLFILGYRYLPRHDLEGTTLHFVCWLASILSWLLFFYYARKTFEEVELRLGKQVLGPPAVAVVIGVLFYLIFLTTFDFPFYRVANLSGANLKWADFRGADLRGAYMRGANLQGANLQGIDLAEADLQWANLQGVNLAKNAKFKEASLHKAKLQKADLRWADLAEVDLKDTKLQKARLREAKLQKANLQNANLQEVDLRGADLQGADLQDADLLGACLLGAKFTVDQVRKAKNWRRAFYDNNFFKNHGIRMGLDSDHNDKLKEKFRGTNCLEGAHFQWKLVQNFDIVKSFVIQTINFIESLRRDLKVITDAIPQGPDLRGANLKDADFKECDLRKAKLQFANLYKADLRGANLEDAELEGANLQWADLQWANLRGTRFNSEPSGKLKDALNWELAFYSEDMLKALNLPEDHNERVRKKLEEVESTERDALRERKRDESRKKLTLMEATESMSKKPQKAQKEKVLSCPRRKR